MNVDISALNPRNWAGQTRQQPAQSATVESTRDQFSQGDLASHQRSYAGEIRSHKQMAFLNRSLAVGSSVLAVAAMSYISIPLLIVAFASLAGGDRFANQAQAIEQGQVPGRTPGG